jgi:hypothetical protein
LLPVGKNLRVLSLNKKIFVKEIVKESEMLLKKDYEWSREKPYDEVESMKSSVTDRIRINLGHWSGSPIEWKAGSGCVFASKNSRALEAQKWSPEGSLDKWPQIRITILRSMIRTRIKVKMDRDPHSSKKLGLDPQPCWKNVRNAREGKVRSSIVELEPGTEEPKLNSLQEPEFYSKKSWLLQKFL